MEGLSEHVVRNTKEVKQLLREGAQLRTTAATKMNKVGVLYVHTCMKFTA